MTTNPPLSYDACGASLKIEFPTKTPLRSTLHCALGAEHRNMPHRASDGTQWDAAPGASDRVYLSPSNMARVAELEQLAAPSEDGALNLGPIIARYTAAIATSPSNPTDARASVADIPALIREVIRLRRPMPTMPGDATLHSALAGIARHIEDMRHVFAELLAATCTGCPVVPLSSNPEDGADIESQPGCPVHGDTADLRRSLAWSAQQQDRIAAALGPEYEAPFGPDVTAGVLRRIGLLAEYQAHK